MRVIALAILVVGCAAHARPTPVPFAHSVVGHRMYVEDGSMVVGDVTQDGRTSAAYCEERRQADLTKRTLPFAQILGITPAEAKTALAVATPPCTPVRLTPAPAPVADMWIALRDGGAWGRTLLVGGTTDQSCRELLGRAAREAGMDLSALQCRPARLERR